MNRRNLLQLAAASPLALLPKMVEPNIIYEDNWSERWDKAVSQAETYWNDIRVLIKPQVKWYVFNNAYLGAKVYDASEQNIFIRFNRVQDGHILYLHNDILEEARRKVCPDWTLSFFAEYDIQTSSGWNAHITHYLTKPDKKLSPT